jgi:hypothetical protein
MSIDQVPAAGAPPLPNGEPSTWIYLADLVLPAEQQRLVEERLRACYWWWARRKHRRDVEDERKLLYFFPGKTVALKRTPRGRTVLMAGDYSSPEYRRFMGNLSPAERSQILLVPIRDPKFIYIGFEAFEIKDDGDCEA